MAPMIESNRSIIKRTPAICNSKTPIIKRNVSADERRASTIKRSVAMNERTMTVNESFVGLLKRRNIDLKNIIRKKKRFQLPISFLISFSFISASIGVSVFTSVFKISSLICSKTGSSNLKKLSCKESLISF
jgi:hypothetical protein